MFLAAIIVITICHFFKGETNGYLINFNTKRDELTSPKENNDFYNDYDDSNKINLEKDTLTPPEVKRPYGLYMKKWSNAQSNGKKEEAPTEESPPKCFHDKRSACRRKIVRIKVYIEDNLWMKMENAHRAQKNDLSVVIASQVHDSLIVVNKFLSRLDNGGFVVYSDGTVNRQSESDMKPSTTYIDRQDNNKTKHFSNTVHLAHTFSFQEAVQNSPNRFDYDVRLLYLDGATLTSEKGGKAEEECVCNGATFGCIVTFAIGNIKNWTSQGFILAHEFGHTLGAKLHDNEYYYRPQTSLNPLLMWSEMDPGVDHIWSPKAKEKIRNHDASCLESDP